VPFQHTGNAAAELLLFAIGFVRRLRNGAAEENESCDGRTASGTSFAKVSIRFLAQTIPGVKFVGRPIMFSQGTDQSKIAFVVGLALAGIPLLLASGSVAAGEGWETQPYGVPSRLLPWTQPGYRGYYETARPAQPPPATVTAAPQKYTITITLLPHKPQGVDPNIGILMAHLPEDALIWFNDHPTKSGGMVRYYESPPLTPGKEYYYTVRIVWHENGQWVSKTERVPIGAGEMRCIYLTPADEKSTIAENLAKLSPEDRKLAETQKFCVEEDNPLGVMGVPVKIMLKGQPVFLCCKGCIEKAQENPEKTLAKLKELKAKNAKTPLTK
jgi:uncharacterized protein (TIGR03000 family)